MDVDWEQHFRPGERLLWQGAPVAGFHQRGKSLFLMAFGLPFLVIGVALAVHGFGALGHAQAISDAGLAIFIIAFALPFGGLGAFLVFGPVVDARVAARHVRYALSTRAAYIRRLFPSPSVRVYPILPSSPVELEQGKRAATVWLHAMRERDSDGDLALTRAGFEHIADAETVFHLIRDLQTREPR